MAAKDIFHDAVKRALKKDDWVITRDPLFISFGGVDMYVDRAHPSYVTLTLNPSP